MTDVVINVIENPYHKAEIKPHHLDVGEARLACFDAFNIVSASQALGGEYEMADEDDDPEPSSLFSTLPHARRTASLLTPAANRGLRSDLR